MIHAAGKRKEAMMGKALAQLTSSEAPGITAPAACILSISAWAATGGARTTIYTDLCEHLLSLAK